MLVVMVLRLSGSFTLFSFFIEENCDSPGIVTSLLPKKVTLSTFSHPAKA